MYFPKLPKELENLTELEERLISPRVPFMTLRDLRHGPNGQISMVGPVVYVPCDILKTMETLPRSAAVTCTIPLLFKRRKTYKNNVYEDAIRPTIVRTALAWLYQNSEIWRTTKRKEKTT